MLYPSFAAWIDSFLACMGGCLGRIAKPASFLPIYNRSEGAVNYHGLPVERSSVSDGFWTSSTCNIDLGNTLSQRSQSSLLSDVVCIVSPATSSNGSEFVNHGYFLWNQIRAHWMGGKQQLHQPRPSQSRTIRVCSTYDSLLGNNKPFRQPVPLSEMVDFLVDVWEDEGLYD